MSATIERASLALIAISLIVMAFWLSTAYGDQPAPPAPQLNYEAMADCLAEQHYVTQYQMTLAQYQKAIRLCDLFTREPSQ